MSSRSLGAILRKIADVLGPCMSDNLAPHFPRDYTYPQSSFGGGKYMRRGGHSRVTIRDRKRLRQLWNVVLRKAGNQRRAAKALGITPVHFWRLLRGQGPPSLSLGLYQRLGNYLARHAPQALPKLNRAVLEPRAQRLLDGPYRDWLTRTLDRFVRHSTALERQLREEYGPLFERLDERFRAGDWLLERKRLAMERILQPLIDGQLSPRGMEAGPAELEHSGWLESYLRAAVRRELVLLRREPDFERAHHLMNTKP